MRERLVTLTLALAALLVFLSLFVHAEGPPGKGVSLPTSADRDQNGLLGALTWLAEEGVRTRPVRERFTALSRLRDLPTRGNLLIVTLPAAVPFRSDEAAALDRWLHQGNTLVVLAALSDRPAWARDHGVLESDLHLITGLEIASVRPARPARSRAGEARPDSGDDVATGLARTMRLMLKPQRDTLVPNRAHRYLEKVGSLTGFSDYPPRGWKLELPRERFPLCLAHLAGSYGCGLWLLADGNSTVVLSAFGSLLTNRALGEGDNARLLANLVRASVAADGAVLFDDQHQGLSDTYDPESFYRDRRLYLTL
ncbi:MAG TPA: DUF4350 domain-containing protein, partial [Steroidobacteraceae bacterium]